MRRLKKKIRSRTSSSGARGWTRGLLEGESTTNENLQTELDSRIKELESTRRFLEREKALDAEADSKLSAAEQERAEMTERYKEECNVIVEARDRLGAAEAQLLEAERPWRTRQSASASWRTGSSWSKTPGARRGRA